MSTLFKDITLPLFHKHTPATMTFFTSIINIFYAKIIPSVRDHSIFFRTQKDLFTYRCLFRRGEWFRICFKNCVWVVVQDTTRGWLQTSPWFTGRNSAVAIIQTAFFGPLVSGHDPPPTPALLSFSRGACAQHWNMHAEKINYHSGSIAPKKRIHTRCQSRAFRSFERKKVQENVFIWIPTLSHCIKDGIYRSIAQNTFVVIP